LKRNETEMKVMWDICSGLGGASEAFLIAGWTVIRIEIEEGLAWVPQTKTLDVLKWREWVDDLIVDHGVPDFIWASPPCKDFSNAFSAPKAIWNREHPGEPYEPDMSLLHAIEDLLARVRPQHFIIENVLGASPYFTPHLGPHFQKVKSFLLWGRCPVLNVPSDWSHSKFDGDTHSTDPWRANKRAYVPLEISQAVVKAITHQTTIEEWC